MDTTQTIVVHKSRANWWGSILRWLRLTNDITIKVYHGYGQPGRYVIYGHVLSLGPLPRKHFSSNVWKNTAALLRLFIVKPFAGARLQLRWEGDIYKTVSEDDGFFKIEWKVNEHLPPGWHPIQVEMTDDDENILTTGTGYMFIPHATQLGFISDIDDTFLISHSSNLRKRLYVLFTRNARSRKPFDGVVRHYQALTLANTTESAPNPFFYVSSSEWNLFNYILEFTTVNGLPRGVFLLSQLKRFSQLFKTGQNKHGTKFMRIVRILEHYPSQRFVLLGDSSQMDPDIYAGTCKSDLKATKLFTVAGWLNNKSEEHNYGAIRLDCSVGSYLGWLGAFWQTSSLVNIPEAIGGYPSDKKGLFHWVSGDKIRAETTRQVFYNNDTSRGEIGAPVATDHPRFGYAALAIHAYDKHGRNLHNQYNHGTRITKAVLDNLTKWRE